MKQFSDFAEEEEPLAGDKIKIDRVLNKEIVVNGYKITQSKFSDSNTEKCLMLQIVLEEEKRIVFTGSTVLLDQVEKYSDEIPFMTTIKSIDRYYTFT